MDQSNFEVSMVDGQTESKEPRRATTTIQTFPGALETDSGFSSAVSSETSVQPAPATPCLLRLRLAQQRAPTERHVGFHAGVIDNEHMNRRKSKCCCIYRKPHPFGESSSSTDDECEHCFGHPEVRARNRLEKQRRQEQQSGCSCCHHHHRLRSNRHNRNNRPPIEEIAQHKDDKQAEEEEKPAVDAESPSQLLNEKTVKTSNYPQL
ncbi:E3 ubiquitin-protein ligase PPP1R11 [Drosophila teissieri]|uniref:E3 ubiquitin-protein ligase PPP1R11 n=1 Tax=Drosophila teissieri TaxID=7243 RepID=UPI001CBA40C5|nr:E3 ubiquitin-protein ligase PPP1R11 [Drosophila teissieri]